MKQSFATFLSLFFIFSAFAQKPEYFDPFGNKTKKKHASFYRTTTEVLNENKDTRYFVREYYLTDTLKSSGYYADQQLTIKDGLFVSYGENGRKKLEVAYSQNVSGHYTAYFENGSISEERSFSSEMPGEKRQTYFENGNLRSECFYEKGELHGPSVYFHENGKPKMKQTFADGKKTGRAFSYYDNGQPEGEENYVSGMLTGESRWYFPNGKLSSVEYYDADTLVRFKMYNEDGSRDTMTQTLTQSPEFPGGMKELKLFLVENLQYPQSAIDHKISGKVYLMFRITAKGEVWDVELVAGIPGCPDCDVEAIRVVKIMPDWIPGKAHNHVTDVHYALPVSFTIK